MKRVLGLGISTALTRVVLALALLMLTVSAAACGSSAAPAATQPPAKAAEPTKAAPAAAQPIPGSASTPAAKPSSSGKPVNLGMVLKNQVNPYFVTLGKGAENATKAMGGQIRILAPSKPDNAEEQIQLVESLIQAKVDAIILTPADSKALVPAVEEAKKAGIPVFVADTKIIGTDVMAFVGVDNVVLGKQTAQIAVDLAKKLPGGKANVIVLEGTAGSSSNVDRQTGVYGVLKNNPAINLLGSMPADYNRVKATSVTEDLLTKYPTANLVLAFNDEMALGAIEAIKAHGKTPGKDILVVGMNAAANALEAMDKGELAGTIYADEYAMGYKSAQYAIAYLRDGTKPPAETLTAAPVPVTQENLAQFKAIRQQQDSGAAPKQ
jgi:ABC-type sugar transport system substrate-binding protein